MNIWLFVSILLLVVVIYLLYKLGQRFRDLAAAKVEAEREWTLKTALEKTYRLPDVEAQALAAIEGQLEQIKSGDDADEEKEEKLRLAVIELYARKAERKKKGNKEE
jgi:hypothetical protein